MRSSRRGGLRTGGAGGGEAAPGLAAAAAAVVEGGRDERGGGDDDDDDDRCRAQPRRRCPPQAAAAPRAVRESGLLSAPPPVAAAATVRGGGRPPATSSPPAGEPAAAGRGGAGGGCGCGTGAERGRRGVGGAEIGEAAASVRRGPSFAAARPPPSPCVTTFRARRGGEHLRGRRLPPPRLCERSRGPGGVWGRRGAAPGSPPAAPGRPPCAWAAGAASEGRRSAGGGFTQARVASFAAGGRMNLGRKSVEICPSRSDLQAAGSTRCWFCFL